MAENKAGNYIKYALGEIVLVVIGILIALQINTWNEAINTHELQKKHLALIGEEMSNNLKFVQKEQRTLVKIIKSQRILISLIDDKAALKNTSETELSHLFKDVLANEIEVEYENAALEELLSAGLLKDVENDSIRSILASWERKMLVLRSQEKSFREYWRLANEFFEAYGNYRTLFTLTGYTKYVKIDKFERLPSNKHVLSIKNYENPTLIYLSTMIHLNGGIYPKYEKDIRELIRLINQELQKT